MSHPSYIYYYVSPQEAGLSRLHHRDFFFVMVFAQALPQLTYAQQGALALRLEFVMHLAILRMSQMGHMVDPLRVFHAPYDFFFLLELCLLLYFTPSLSQPKYRTFHLLVYL